MNIEPLESRIAPAATFIYIDLDGDVVTIATSKGTNADLAEANGVLTFSAPDPGDPDVPRQLYKIDLSLAFVFADTDLSIKVTRKAALGDGLVHVGFIDAREQIAGGPDTNLVLGVVTVGGDLGQIESGSGIADSVKSLTVQSLGLFGLATQGGTGDLVSIIEGPLGSLKVRGDVREAAVCVDPFAQGSIGSVTIGGSLIGGDGPDTGVIFAGGDIGPVKIGGDIRGGDREPGGGVTGHSGAIEAGGKIASVTIGGSLLRGTGVLDGLVGSNGSLGPVKVAGDLTGALGSTGGVQSLTVGGSMRPRSFIGNVEGAVRVAGDFEGDLSLRQPASVLIGGSVLGGGITGTLRTVTIGGSVIDASIGGGGLGGNVGAVKIGGDLIGGSVFAGTEMNPSSIATLGSVTIGGSFIGVGTTGRIFSNGNMGAVKIGGSVIGDGDGSATIRSYQIDGLVPTSHIASVTIGGSLVGGPGIGSAQIEAGLRVGAATASGNLGPVNIRGSVLGDGHESAFIRATGTIAGIKIGGSLVGGAGMNSGGIFTPQNLGAVRIGGNIVGGAGVTSGAIEVLQDIASVTLGGSLIGGSMDFAGAILSGTAMGLVKIGHDVQGGSGVFSGRIRSMDTLAGLTIGGSLIGGTNNDSGEILVIGDIGPVKIGGDLQGGSIAGTAASLDGAGFIRGDRIASVTIGGSILAGFDTSTAGSLGNNASIRVDDDIGAIKVKGSIAGTLTADGRGRPAISARGQETLAPGATKDLAIKSLTVGGRVDRAIIVAGFDPDDPLNDGSNGNASIGPVRVGGDWIATSISAGVNDTNSNGFGNDDQRIAGATLVSRIASIKIKGTVAGTAAANDHFGFTAAQIGSFKALGFTAKLNSAQTDAAVELSLATADVTIREV